MSQGRQMRRAEYIEGNTARQLVERQEGNIGLLERVNSEDKRKRKMGMSFACVLYIAALLTVLCYVVVGYLDLKSELGSTRDELTRSNSYLTQITLENNDEYSKITDEVDIEKIKQVAINELGMCYPSEDQIITYKREKSDYVRQVSDISD